MDFHESFNLHPSEEGTPLPILQSVPPKSLLNSSSTSIKDLLILWHLDRHNRSLQPLSSLVNLYTIKKSYGQVGFG